MSFQKPRQPGTPGVALRLCFISAHPSHPWFLMLFSKSEESIP
jgi:hypothetical protein